MSVREAATFGGGHAKAIAEQSLLGVHRTALLWLIPGAILIRGAQQVMYSDEVVTRRRFALRSVGAGAGMQLMWIGGFAVVSGTRTAIRLCRLTAVNMLPIEITCADAGIHVYACAHRSPLADSWYVDGVFAWPRHQGGGEAVVRRLLARADAQPVALTLTALSPRVAARYRKVGFRYKLWIYFMRREPVV